MIPTYQEIVRTVPTWFFSAWITIVGACVGSFLNVCIYRIPKNESVVTPRSHCGCGKLIAWYDNIPILSWLILRGRARCCGRPFSFRYPAVEILTAALFLLCWTLFPAGKAVASMLLCSIVICAFFIDFDHMIIPSVFTTGGAAAGLALSFAFPSLHHQTHEVFMIAALRSTHLGLLGLFVGSGIVLWIAVFAEAILKKEAMGFADVTFLGAVGAFVGWQGAVFGMFGGAILGCVWYVIALAWKKVTGQSGPLALPAENAEGQPTELSLNAHVPFGPMLGVASLIYLFVGHQWMDAYFAELQTLL